LFNSPDYKSGISKARIANPHQRREETGPYILAFKDLYLTYRRSVYREQQGDTKGMITAAALVPIIDTGWTIIKNIRDMSGKKVDGVIELLNNLRLNSPQEVAKNK